MADDAIAFIHALRFDKVILFGFSLGGFVTQAIMHTRPNLVSKAVLAGTGPAGGKGISNVGAVLRDAVSTATKSARHPKEILFFTQTRDGQKAAGEFLQRLNHRVDDRDAPISDEAVRAQLTAIRGIVLLSRWNPSTSQCWSQMAITTSWCHRWVRSNSPGVSPTQI
jgi:pimeloyl-ACP methyl ester carboxylesterase